MNTPCVNAREEHLHLRATARSAVQVSHPPSGLSFYRVEILRRLHLARY